MEESKKKAAQKTTLGLSENLAASLSYVFGWVSGIIFFVIDRKNDFVRFHALQSVFAFIALNVLSFISGLIPFFGWFVGGILWLLGFAVWIILIVKAYKGERYKLPYIGDWVESALRNK